LGRNANNPPGEVSNTKKGVKKNGTTTILR
jgi:hypothetical protein